MADAERSELRTPRHASPITALGVPEEEQEDEEQEEEEQDDHLPMERVIRLSNAHVELMLIHVLGPPWRHGNLWDPAPDQDERRGLILEAVHGDELGLKKIEDVFRSFVSEYQKRVSAKKMLTGMEVFAEERREGRRQATAVPVKPRVEVMRDDRKLAQPKKEDKKTKFECYRCGKEGHRTFECPDRAKDSKDGRPDSIKKIGSLLQIKGKKDGPYLAVDVSGVSEQERSMMAYADSGAEANVVGEKWVQHLQLHGGVVS